MPNRINFFGTERQDEEAFLEDRGDLPHDHDQGVEQAIPYAFLHYGKIFQKGKSNLHNACELGAMWSACQAEGVIFTSLKRK